MSQRPLGFRHRQQSPCTVSGGPNFSQEVTVSIPVEYQLSLLHLLAGDLSDSQLHSRPRTMLVLDSNCLSTVSHSIDRVFTCLEVVVAYTESERYGCSLWGSRLSVCGSNGRDHNCEQCHRQAFEKLSCHVSSFLLQSPLVVCACQVNRALRPVCQS